MAFEKRRVVVFGFGRTGTQLCHHLQELGYTIRVACYDKHHITSANQQGISVKQIDFKKRDAIKTLEIDQEQEILYCALDKMSHNLFLILTLRELYPQSRIIAISDSTENKRKLNYVGATKVIDIYETTARHISDTLIKPALISAVDTFIYHRNGMEIADIEIPQKSPLLKKHVYDIDFKSDGLLLLAIVDRSISDRIILADRGIKHRLQEGDILVVAGKTEDIGTFRERNQAILV